jgi:hypothetical protein
LSAALDAFVACTAQLAPGSEPFEAWLTKLALLRPRVITDAAAVAQAKVVYEHCKGFYDGTVPKDTLRALQARYAASANAAERARVARELMQRSVTEIDSSRLRGTGDYGAYRSLAVAASHEVVLIGAPPEIEVLHRALIGDTALCGAGAYCGRDSFAFAEACLFYGACSGRTSVEALRIEATLRGATPEAMATLDGVGMQIARWLQGAQVTIPTKSK